MSRFRFYILSVFLDAVFANVALFTAFALRFLGAIPARNFQAYVIMAPLVTLLYLITGWIYGLYEPENIDTPWGVSSSAFKAVTLAVILSVAVAFLGGTATTAFPRWTFPLVWVFSLVLAVGWRLLFLRFGHIRWPEQRTLIIGDSPLVAEIARYLGERQKWGWTLVGSLDGPALDELHERIVADEVNRIIVADPAGQREFIEQIVLTDELRLTVDVVPELYETFIGRTDAILGDIPLMRIASSGMKRYQRAIKRLLDLILSVLFLIIASPLLLIATIALLIDDGRPVLYRQERVGRDERPFRIIKFRTMKRNAEQLSGPVLATEDDPRITRVGRVLRRYRIDEILQLANVVRGDMSFIGPRPERPVFVAEYLESIAGYGERFHIKPGVTGLAQVNGGYATTPERKLKYDLMYLYHQSFMMDMQIMVETAKVVLTGRGAQ
ncbi:MAG: sugar transferase [Coriobacteriia bacterium]|nr:sugar transferase [Coriobacteriia bacterium]